MARGHAAPGLIRRDRPDAGYPARLAERLEDEAPSAVWIAGAPGRLEAPQVAFVGSREAPELLLKGAGRLAREVAELGWVIASGCARGADMAALRGGLRGCAGALGIPACGLLQTPRSLAADVDSGLTLLGIASPLQPFNAGYAIRRNAMLAAMSDALVLVAAGRKSGSWYAVRRALSLGTPVFCFEFGGCTPEGNAWLLRRGMAEPVGLSERPASAAARIVERARRGRMPATRIRTEQGDLLAGLGEDSVCRSA